MKIMRRKSGETWCLRGYVPTRFARIEPRKEVWISLHTDSETVAKAKAPVIRNDQMELWEARLRGDSSEEEVRYEALSELAQRRGHPRRSREEVLRLSRDDLLRLIEDIPTRDGKPDTVVAAANLSVTGTPQIKVSRALELYWPLAKSRTLGKSEAQVKKWESPIKQAFRDFIAVIGDKPLAEVSRDDVRLFRDWWLERIETEELNPATANKNMDHFGKVLKLVNEEKRLGLTLPLGGLRLEEGEKDQRPSFSEGWIRKTLLKFGALDGRDAEARAVLLIMVNTGARPSEICALHSATIRLKHDIPHISIEPDGRKLKTKHSRRVIPLVGLSLEAIRGFADG